MSNAKIAAYAVSGVLATGLLSQSLTTVGQNQVACFRTFGKADCGPLVEVMVDKKPEKVHDYYGPGLHFMTPFITSVDKMQVSQRLTDVHTAKLTIGAQNQPVEVDYQLLVNTPKEGTHRPDGTYVDSVYHLLYEVGQAGSGDVDNVVDRFVDASLNKAFATTEPDELSTKRTAILADVTGKVGGDLKELGVLEDSDIKVTRLELLGSWKTAANTRVESIGRKNAADNDADAARSRGRGEGDAILEKAKGQADATKQITEADAAYISKLRSAFGGDDNALAIFLMTKSGTALPQVLGTGGIQVVPQMAANAGANRPGDPSAAPALPVPRQ